MLLYPLMASGDADFPDPKQNEYYAGELDDRERLTEEHNSCDHGYNRYYILEHCDPGQLEIGDRIILKQECHYRRENCEIENRQHDTRVCETGIYFARKIRAFNYDGLYDEADKSEHHHDEGALEWCECIGRGFAQNIEDRCRGDSQQEEHNTLQLNGAGARLGDGYDDGSKY